MIEIRILGPQGAGKQNIAAVIHGALRRNKLTAHLQVAFDNVDEIGSSRRLRESRSHAVDQGDDIFLYTEQPR